jgi:Protein of unknown function (DUF2845)
MRRATLELCVVLLLGPVVAQADILVCKQGRTVQPGATPEEVLQKCGPPSSKESRTEDLRAVNAGGASYKHGEITVETWRYDRGTQKAAAILEIREGKVVSIVFEK